MRGRYWLVETFNLKGNHNLWFTQIIAESSVDGNHLPRLLEVECVNVFDKFERKDAGQREKQVEEQHQSIVQRKESIEVSLAFEWGDQSGQ